MLQCIGLKEFMAARTKEIYAQSLQRLQDPDKARAATRMVLQSVSDAAGRGACREDAAWLSALTDNACARLSPRITPAVAPPREEFAEEAAVWEEPRRVAEPERYAAVQSMLLAAQREAAERTAQAQSALRRQEEFAYPAREEAEDRPRLFEREEEFSYPAREEAEDVPRLFEREEAFPEENGEDEDEEELPGRGAGFGMVFLIFFLVLLVLALLWMLLVMLMSRGLLPNMDMGFANWFNTNVFKLF